jgi:hypothetical protein
VFFKEHFSAPVTTIGASALNDESSARCLRAFPFGGRVLLAALEEISLARTQRVDLSSISLRGLQDLLTAALGRRRAAMPFG